jgi:hypothetical protein
VSRYTNGAKAPATATVRRVRRVPPLRFRASGTSIVRVSRYAPVALYLSLSLSRVSRLYLSLSLSLASLVTLLSLALKPLPLKVRSHCPKVCTLLLSLSHKLQLFKVLSFRAPSFKVLVLGV